MDSIAKSLFLLLVVSVGISAQQLSSAWTILNRAGDYSNSETDCLDPKEVSTSGSLLILQTENSSETCGDAFHSASSHPYTSGGVQWSSYNFLYGTIEIRAKTAGAHTWPALWLLGSNCQGTNPSSSDNSGTCSWPNAGSDEIDMVEVLGGTTIDQNVYANGNTSGAVCDVSGVSDPSTNWHTYIMTWTSSSITFTIDGSPSNCSYSSNIPSHPMFLVMQTATGGVSGTPSGLPTTMQVDYVKVTQNSVTTFFDDFAASDSSQILGHASLGGSVSLQ